MYLTIGTSINLRFHMKQLHPVMCAGTAVASLSTSGESREVKVTSLI